MNDDTIFLTMSLGEEVIGKYRDSTFGGQLEVIIVLTNFRILIRWKFTSCAFFFHSLYSSIRHHYSMYRINEILSNPSLLLISILLIVLVAEFTCTVVIPSFIDSAGVFKAIGVSLMIGSAAGFVLLFILYRKK
jgi:hypothetical protein